MNRMKQSPGAVLLGLVAGVLFVAMEACAVAGYGLTAIWLWNEARRSSGLDIACEAI
jgi:hypothetical protein